MRVFSFLLNRSLTETALSWLSQSGLLLAILVPAGCGTEPPEQVDSSTAQLAQAQTLQLSSTTLFSADFNADAGGFAYSDNGFRGTAQPAYATGTRVTTGGNPSGALQVQLGGVDNLTISGISGGWTRTFTTVEPLRVTLSLDYNLTQTSEYETDELSQVLVDIDGSLRGISTQDFVSQIAGDGNGGAVRTTGFRKAKVELGTLPSGNHTLRVGGFNSKKNASNESTTVLIDNLVLAGTPPPAARVIVEARFDSGLDSFTFLDDAFNGTNAPAYASGVRDATAGRTGGGLRVNLGGIDNTQIVGMSGGFQRTFSVAAPTQALLSFRYNLAQSANYESDEVSQVLVMVDGVERGVPPNTAAPNAFVDQVVGNGNGGTTVTTGFRLAQISLGTLAAGNHTLTIGGFNNKKSLTDESTTVIVDDVMVTQEPSFDPVQSAQALVSSLNLQRFKDNIQTLAAFGDRSQLTTAGSTSYNNGVAWVRQQLEAAGYGVEAAPYVFQGVSRESIYATKIGSLFPDRVYIISAHLDGRGGGGAADDDGSGSSLVLEAARALSGVETDSSVRFVFWNNEETGLNGSAGYASGRVNLQGVEQPLGSRVYPEPTWLGVIQHDMILFDHGLPPGPNQSANADVDIEFQASSTRAFQSQELANFLRGSNTRHSSNYPAEVSNNMSNTDSASFQNLAPSVSVRENRRIAEIGNGSNPHWHQSTDRFTTYSSLDFLLGFNALQLTLGAAAELGRAQPP